MTYLNAVAWPPPVGCLLSSWNITKLREPDFCNDTNGRDDRHHLVFCPGESMISEVHQVQSLG